MRKLIACDVTSTVGTYAYLHVRRVGSISESARRGSSRQIQTGHALLRSRTGRASPLPLLSLEPTMSLLPLLLERRCFGFFGSEGTAVHRRLDRGVRPLQQTHVLL